LCESRYALLYVGPGELHHQGSSFQVERGTKVFELLAAIPQLEAPN
jgi:hypothetical protein